MNPMLHMPAGAAQDMPRARLPGLLNGLRERLAGATGRRPDLVLQYLGLTPTQVRTLRDWLRPVAAQLELRLALQPGPGQLIVIEQDAAARMAPAALEALGDRQPVLVVALATGAEAGDVRVEQRLAERGQRDLLLQLSELTLVRRLSPQWHGSGWEPESGIPDPAARRRLEQGDEAGPDDEQAPPLGAERTRFVLHLLRGLHDATTAPLMAAYGPGAALQVDFAQRIVRIELKAMRRLRVQQVLPRCVDAVRLDDEVILRELDETVWDVAMACGRHRLLGAPQDWWQRALRPTREDGARSVMRLTRLPSQLRLAHCLFAAAPGSLDAETLRLAAGNDGSADGTTISMLDVRRFLQACVFLQLVRFDTDFAPTLPVPLEAAH